MTVDLIQTPCSRSVRLTQFNRLRVLYVSGGGRPSPVQEEEPPLHNCKPPLQLCSGGLCVDVSGTSLMWTQICCSEACCCVFLSVQASLLHIWKEDDDQQQQGR